jgi:hypothetical protein
VIRRRPNFGAFRSTALIAPILAPGSYFCFGGIVAVASKCLTGMAPTFTRFHRFCLRSKCEARRVIRGAYLCPARPLSSTRDTIYRKSETMAVLRLPTLASRRLYLSLWVELKDIKATCLPMFIVMEKIHISSITSTSSSIIDSLI